MLYAFYLYYLYIRQTPFCLADILGSKLAGLSGPCRPLTPNHTQTRPNPRITGEHTRRKYLFVKLDFNEMFIYLAIITKPCKIAGFSRFSGLSSIRVQAATLCFARFVRAARTNSAVVQPLARALRVFPLSRLAYSIRTDDLKLRSVLSD